MIDIIKTFLVFTLTFAFASNGYETLESLYHSPIREAYWYLLLFAITALVLLLTPMESISNIPKHVFIWILLFLITITYSYAVSSQSELVKTITISMIKALSVFISMFILVTSEKILKVGLFAILAVLLVSVSLNIYEFFNESIEWSYIPGRSAGWYYDANISARNITMSLILAAIIIPKKFLWPTIAFATVGVLLTFSRGGWVMLFMAIVGISTLRAIKPGKSFSFLDIKPTSFLAMVFGGIIASSLLALFISGEAFQLVKGTALEEYLREDTIGRLSGDFKDDSSSYRKTVLMAALQMGVEHPITGAGLGSTHEWEYTVGPHNDYATLFAESGIIGLSTYLFLLGFVWVTGSRYAKLLVLILAFSSITSHTTFQTPPTYIFLALALLHKDEKVEPQSHRQPVPT